MTNIITINNTEHLTAMIKAIVPRSFEKTFGGLSTNEIVAGFAFCTIGLNQAELNTGLIKISQMGFCPDPAMFAKWCKGLDGFDTTDHIADSYIGKHGALNNIIKWLQSDQQSPISMAEKQAYDETYTLWQNIQSQNDNTKAELAFKDHYSKIVADLVAQRVPCQNYVAPVAISQQNEKQQSQPVSRDEALANLAKLQRLIKEKQATTNPLCDMEAVA